MKLLVVPLNVGEKHEGFRALRAGEFQFQACSGNIKVFDVGEARVLIHFSFNFAAAKCAPINAPDVLEIM